MENNEYRVKEVIDLESIKKQNDNYSFFLLVGSFVTFFFLQSLIGIVFSVIAIFHCSRNRNTNLFLIGHILFIILIVISIVLTMTTLN